jgi:hypothetical protein
MKRTATLSRLKKFRRWIYRLQVEGKMQYFSEMEMWLKSFERYFRSTNLPLSEDELRQATLRDYSEELKVVNDVIFRISQVCTLMLSEEQISYSSFTKYVENSLKQSYFTDRYTKKLIHEQKPEKNVNLLMESLLDIRTVIHELSKLSKISYLCFTSVGKMISRELRKGVYLDFFLEKKYASFFDQVHNIQVVRIVRAIQIPGYKRSVAAVFHEFFRMIRYLNYIGLQMQDANSLKRSLMIFSLVHAELKLLMEYLTEEFLRKEHPDANFTELIEGIIYSLSMELKKVMQRELLGTAALRQYELIFTKVQNSQGILLNSLQQIVFSIAQYFEPRLEGQQIFPDYVTRLEQSLKLRADIFDLCSEVTAFGLKGNLHQISSLIKKIEWFKLNSMKFLMYKDWFEFDNFYIEVCACKTTGNLNFVLHRFEAFLNTLLKEVNKRAILSTHPFPPAAD